jgi:DNA-binding transcriptional LysR family regulator
MDMHALRVVLAVGRAGSMAEAARALQYSVSSVSYQVKRCEQALGVPIFDRTVEGVSPTRRGREFLQLAATIVYLLDTFALRATDVRRRADLREP